MNTKLAFEIAHVVKRAVQYVKEDQSARYGLKDHTTIILYGDGVGIGRVDAGVLHIVGKKGGDTCTLLADPFKPEDGLWNGPDVIPNDWSDGSMEASLWHDLIWHYAADIAEQTGLTVREVKSWGNGILKAGWEAYGVKLGKDGWWNRFKAWCAYQLTELVKGWYGKNKAGLLVLAVLSCGGGCYTAPDWTAEVPEDPVEYEQGYPAAEGGEK